MDEVFTGEKEKKVSCFLSRKSQGKGNGKAWAIIWNRDHCGLVATYDTHRKLQRNSFGKAGWSKMVTALHA